MNVHAVHVVNDVHDVNEVHAVELSEKVHTFKQQCGHVNSFC